MDGIEVGQVVVVFRGAQQRVGVVFGVLLIAGRWWFGVRCFGVGSRVVVPRPFGDGATDLGDQIGDGEPTVGVGSTVVVLFDGWLSRLQRLSQRRRPHPSIDDGDRLRGGPEPLPRRGASRSRRRSGKPYVIGIRAVSGCLGAALAMQRNVSARPCGRIVVVAAVPRWWQLGSATDA